jgi:peptide/nickel transport system substrate-binding protein
MRRYTPLLWAGTASLALAAAAQAQPADDTIVVGLSADITTFEPANISSRDNANIARHIFGRSTPFPVTARCRPISPRTSRSRRTG